MCCWLLPVTMLAAPATAVQQEARAVLNIVEAGRQQLSTVTEQALTNVKHMALPCHWSQQTTAIEDLARC